MLYLSLLNSVQGMWRPCNTTYQLDVELSDHFHLEVNNVSVARVPEEEKDGKTRSAEQ